MCRLALISDKALLYLGSDLLAAAFTELTKAMGGSGIGGSVLMASGNVYTYKGVKLTEKELAEWMVNKARRGGRYFIYHTRFATTGSVCDDNCHPFTHGDLTMAHNGVASTFSGMGDRTDSEAVARVVALGYDLSWLADVSGVWVGWKGQRPFVVKGQAHSSLHLLSNNDGKMWMFMSQVPQCIKGLFDVDTDLNYYTYIDGVEKHTRYVPATTYATKTSKASYDVAKCPKSDSNSTSTGWEDTYNGWEYGDYKATRTESTTTADKATAPTLAVVKQPTLIPEKAGNVEDWRNEQIRSIAIVNEMTNGELHVRMEYSGGKQITSTMGPAGYNSILHLVDPELWACKQAVRATLSDDQLRYMTEIELEGLATLDLSEQINQENEEPEGGVLVQVDNDGSLGYKRVSWAEYEEMMAERNNVAKSSFNKEEVLM